MSSQGSATNTGCALGLEVGESSFAPNPVSSLNKEYDAYRDWFIREHGMYRYTLPPSTIPKPIDPRNLNTAYEQQRQELSIQNREYMPYNALQYQSLYQNPSNPSDFSYTGACSDLQKLYDENDLKTMKIIHAPDIQFPFDAGKDKAALRIQRAWRACISDPSYSLCRKRLLHEFNDITHPTSPP